MLPPISTIQQHEKKKKVLPAEILEQIFKQLPARDLYSCQYVCHSWHTVAKRDFYKDVEFNTSFSINLFLTCITTKNNSTVPSPGLFVKRIFFNHAPTSRLMQNFSVGSTLSCQHMQALARACPSVTTVDCTQNLNSVVVTGLLSLDDDSWKHLSSFPDGNRVPLDLYRRCAFKFRRSITTLYFDMIKPLDFSYLCQFPSLTILDLSGAPIHCLNELEYVLSTCRQLTQLVLTLKMEGKSIGKQQQIVYPTLKLLKIRTDDDEIDYSILKYMMHKFNNLVSLEMYGMDLLDASLKNQSNFQSLARWMNSLKSTELVLRGHDYNRIPQVATAYLSGLLKTQLPHMHYNTTLNIHNTNPGMINTNNCTFLVFLTMFINQTWMQRDIDIQLPQFETDDRAIHMKYILQFAPYVNELFISYEGTRFYPHGCTWLLENVIEHCSVLRSIHVNYCELGSGIYGQVNESITNFSISNSQIAPEFFRTLSFYCPKLKNVSLNRNFHTRDHRYGLLVDMPHTSFDNLSLMGEEVHFPWMFSRQQENSNFPRWVIKITTSVEGTRYFQIDAMNYKIYKIKKEHQHSLINNTISIGIVCKDIRKLKISTSLIDTTLDL